MKPVYPAPRALPSYENLLLEMVEPNILKVTLNRPKAYNALSHGLVEDLTNLSQWLVDEYYNIRVVLAVWRRRGQGLLRRPGRQAGPDRLRGRPSPASITIRSSWASWSGTLLRLPSPGSP